MESKKLMIICMLIIAIAAITAVFLIYSNDTSQETSLVVVSNSSLYNGDNLTIKLTSGGVPMANQQINMTIKDSEGNPNYQKLTTNNDGIASLTLDGVAPGNYTVETVYEGNSSYKSSNVTFNLEVNEEVQEQTQYSSSSQYSDPHSDWVCEGDTWYSKKLGDGEYGLYDKQSGRMIGTGDMPDRHGYHDKEYVDKYSSTVKYRSNGEYYD